MLCLNLIESRDIQSSGCLQNDPIVGPQPSRQKENHREPSLGRETEKVDDRRRTQESSTGEGGKSFGRHNVEV